MEDVSMEYISDKFDEQFNKKFDRQGKPIDFKEWAVLHGDYGYKRVAEDQIGNLWISTVWLGLDHSFNDSSLIFESMVFDKSNEQTGVDIDCRRYATEEEAFAGHKEILQEMYENRFVGYGNIELDTLYVITEVPTLEGEVG